jgi:hypothetical protein
MLAPWALFAVSVLVIFLVLMRSARARERTAKRAGRSGRNREDDRGDGPAAGKPKTR